MSERNKEKERTCYHCKKKFTGMTAKAIKAHAETCNANPTANK